MKGPRQTRAFTLLEVMIAIGVFCIAVFAILDLVNRNLRAARMLQPDSVDAGSLAAELMLTNKLQESSASGDFGDLYPGYSWSREITLFSTNGLFRVDFTVARDGGGPNSQSHMSMLLFRPDSGASGNRSGSAGSRTPTSGGRR